MSRRKQSAATTRQVTPTELGQKWWLEYGIGRCIQCGRTSDPHFRNHLNRKVKLCTSCGAKTRVALRAHETRLFSMAADRAVELALEQEARMRAA